MKIPSHCCRRRWVLRAQELPPCSGLCNEEGVHLTISIADS